MSSRSVMAFIILLLLQLCYCLFLYSINITTIYSSLLYGQIKITVKIKSAFGRHCNFKQNLELVVLEKNTRWYLYACTFSTVDLYVFIKTFLMTTHHSRFVVLTHTVLCKTSFKNYVGISEHKMFLNYLSCIFYSAIVCNWN